MAVLVSCVTVQVPAAAQKEMKSTMDRDRRLL